MEKLMEEPKASTPIPTGCVRRVLNVRDRYLIHKACLSYAPTNEGRNYKRMLKVKAFTDAIGYDELTEYFDRLNDAYDQKRQEWTKEKNLYAYLVMVHAGAMKKADYLEIFPGADTQKLPPKPPYRAPEPSPEEQRGPEKDLDFPSRMDTFIQDALKSMVWDDSDYEYVTELAEKYGLPLGD